MSGTDTTIYQGDFDIPPEYQWAQQPDFGGFNQYGTDYNPVGYYPDLYQNTPYQETGTKGYQSATYSPWNYQDVNYNPSQLSNYDPRSAGQFQGYQAGGDYNDYNQMMNMQSNTLGNAISAYGSQTAQGLSDLYASKGWGRGPSSYMEKQYADQMAKYNSGLLAGQLTPTLGAMTSQMSERNQYNTTLANQLQNQSQFNATLGEQQAQKSADFGLAKAGAQESQNQFAAQFTQGQNAAAANAQTGESQFKSNLSQKDMENKLGAWGQYAALGENARQADMGSTLQQKQLEQQGFMNRANAQNAANQIIADQQIAGQVWQPTTTTQNFSIMGL